MAKVNYAAISRGIRTILQADPNTSSARISIETDLNFSNEPQVAIYQENRETPESQQTLSAGRSTVFLVRSSLVCRQFSMNNIEEAMDFRDILIGNVETALMADRTLNDSVDHSWLEGGDFGSGKEEQSFVSEGEVVVISRVKATT